MERGRWPVVIVSQGVSAKSRAETYLGGHHPRIDSREHVQSKGGSLASARLTLTDEIARTDRQLRRQSACTGELTYGFIRSMGSAFS